MGTTVKKVAAKSGHANKSGTKMPGAGLKASGHRFPVSKIAPRKAPTGQKPVAAELSQPAKPTPAKKIPAKKAPAKKTEATPLKSAPPNAAPKPAAPKAAPSRPASKAAPPNPAETLPAEAAAPPLPKPPPRPVVAPPPAMPAPPTPKPTLVRLSSLEPAEAARLTAVRNLLEAQGRHDLPGILACFGSQPTLEFAGGPRHIGAERVGQIYGDLLRAFPDLAVDVLAEHLADRSIVVEMVLQGTHRQQWLGMAPRGRPLSLPVCNVFLFDKRDQISALRIYLDRNLAIVQLTSGLLR